MVSAYQLANDPTWTNLGWLIADGLAVVIPYAPGTYVVKAVGKADDVTDGVKVLNKSIDSMQNLAKKTELTNKGFASDKLLISHFEKHAKEFKGAFLTADEYLKGAQDVMQNGYKVEYQYKGETRLGYVQFIENDSKGNAKFAFVGTNNSGNITTFHVESGKTF